VGADKDKGKLSLPLRMRAVEKSVTFERKRERESGLKLRLASGSSRISSPTDGCCAIVRFIPEYKDLTGCCPFVFPPIHHLLRRSFPPSPFPCVSTSFAQTNTGPFVITSITFAISPSLFQTLFLSRLLGR
jgi:hypothetical protein